MAARGGQKSGRGDRRGRKRDDESGHDVKLSKLLSYTLRHGAVKEGLDIQTDGFVYLNDLLALEKFNKFCEQDVRNVVEQNDKQRFELGQDEADQRLKIRATQGHTMNVVEDTGLEPVDPEKLPEAIHGTNHRVINIIKRDGLSRMGRHHIHMAVGLPGDDGVISGMRSSCRWLVYVNVKQAHQDGLRFFRSKNNVILCGGDEAGYIKPKYLHYKERK